MRKDELRVQISSLGGKWIWGAAIKSNDSLHISPEIFYREMMKRPCDTDLPTPLKMKAVSLWMSYFYAVLLLYSVRVMLPWPVHTGFHLVRGSSANEARWVKNDNQSELLHTAIPTNMTIVCLSSRET